jgi:adenylate kinase family enzyme
MPIRNESLILSAGCYRISGDEHWSPGRRILVTGNAGSGKTTLSRWLGVRLGLPVISMERIVWDPGWTFVPKEEADRRLAPVLAQECWIIDGVSTRACEAADMIVFLDFPVSTCFARAMKRSMRHLFHQRSEMPERCPEISILWGMTKIIFQFPRTTRPRILELFSRFSNEKALLRIQTVTQMRELMGNFSRAPSH